jgi:heme-degrading monooxygenase HmoA
VMTKGNSNMADQAEQRFGLFFEVRPKAGRRQDYFDHVDRLKPVLAKHDGLLWLQRYASADHDDLILSHQLWASETALAGWRRDADHRRSQQAGITAIFADYRIRVGPRLWHWPADTNTNTDNVPNQDVTRTPLILALYSHTAPDPDQLARLGTVTGRYTAFAADEVDIVLLNPTAPLAALPAMIAGTGAMTASLFGVSRDYGLFDRAAAPQAR